MSWSRSETGVPDYRFSLPWRSSVLQVLDCWSLFERHQEASLISSDSRSRSSSGAMNTFGAESPVFGFSTPRYEGRVLGLVVEHSDDTFLGFWNTEPHQNHTPPH